MLILADEYLKNISILESGSSDCRVSPHQRAAKNTGTASAHFQILGSDLSAYKSEISAANPAVTPNCETACFL